MRRLAVALVLFLVAVAAVAAIFHQSVFAAKPPADYPVSVTFRDVGGCMPPLNLPDCSGDRILSDGKNLSSYTNGEGNKNGRVSAVIVNDPRNAEYLNLILELGDCAASLANPRRADLHTSRPLTSVRDPATGPRISAEAEGR